VDVGATNTRIQILISDEMEKIPIYKFECKCTLKLVQELESLGESIYSIFGKESSGSALALAGPIQEGGFRVEITNYTGEKLLEKKQLPQSLFRNTFFLNDLEACCYGILSIGLEGKLGDYFINAWSKEKEKKEIKFNSINYGILAMGTGLGTGTILSRKEGTFSILALEAGHCKATFPGRSSKDREKDVYRLEYLSKKIYDSKYSIEFEDICSGRGLESCYEFETLNMNQKKLTSKEISQESLQGNKYAEDAMLAHYRYLMKAAQNITVMTVCKGVFFAGDNQVNNEEFFSKYSGVLQQEFNAHVKSEWLESMVAYRQVEPCNFNLQGAFYYILNHVKQSKL